MIATNHHRTTQWSALMLAATVLLFPSMCAAGDDPPIWSREHGETVEVLRTVGIALYQWRQDEFAAPEDEPLSALRVADTPVIEAAKLATLLVPAYLPELPTSDGWGNALEFRLDREGESRPMMVVRSAGANGEIDEETYAPRAFGPEDERDDLVWADGYFVRWPRPPAE